MPDSFIQVPPDSTGKQLDTRTAPDGNHREVITVGSPTTADVAEVDAANGVDVDVTRLPPLVAGTANIGDVDVLTLPALPAGSNNIGDVDIVSLPNEGQQTMANSISVAIASDQSAVPVSGTVAVTGSATLAEQQTQTAHLATIAGDTTAIETAVQILDDWDESDRAKVNPIAGQAGVQGGAGAVSALTQRVVIATDQTAVPVSGTVAVTGSSTLAEQQTQTGHLAQIEIAVEILDNAISGSEMQVDVVAPLPAGTNNIGDVDVLSLPAITGTVTANAGTNLNTSALALEAGGNLAAAAASLGTLDNAIAGSEMQVDVVAALPAGNNNIGDVDVASVAAGTVIEVVGDVAADAAVPANPVIIGGRASTAQPTAVSADGDSVNVWANRKGSLIVSTAPHVGYLNDPWALTSVTAQYTTTQTSTVLLAGGASERICVTKIGIQAGATTAATVQVYFGTGAYSRGTSLAIFDGEFAPSATLKPGVRDTGPFISATNGDDVLVTTSAGITLTVTLWFYLIT